MAGVCERMGGDVGGLGGVDEDLGCEDGAAGVSCIFACLCLLDVCMYVDKGRSAGSMCFFRERIIILTGGRFSAPGCPGSRCLGPRARWRVRL